MLLYAAWCMHTPYALALSCLIQKVPVRTHLRPAALVGVSPHIQAAHSPQHVQQTECVCPSRTHSPTLWPTRLYHETLDCKMLKQTLS